MTPTDDGGPDESWLGGPRAIRRSRPSPTDGAATTPTPTERPIRRPRTRRRVAAPATQRRARSERARPSPSRPGRSSACSRSSCSRSCSSAAGSCWQLDPPGGAGAPRAVEIEPGWGAKEAGDALQTQRRDRLVARVPGLGRRCRAAARSRPGPTSSARTWACARRRTRSTRGPSTAAGQRRPHGARAPARPHASSRSPTASARCPGTTAPRSSRSRSRASPLEVPAGDQTSLEGFTWPDTYFVGEPRPTSRSSRPSSPSSTACRRGEPRERAGASG